VFDNASEMLTADVKVGDRPGENVPVKFTLLNVPTL